MDELDPINCRTCSEYTYKNYNNITNICYSDIPLKEIIMLLVPELEETLSNDDFICSRCSNILLSCLKFIEKCLEVDAAMRQTIMSKEFINDDCEVSLEGNIRISPVKIHETDLSGDSEENSTEENISQDARLLPHGSQVLSGSNKFLHISPSASGTLYSREEFVDFTQYEVCETHDIDLISLSSDSPLESEECIAEEKEDNGKYKQDNILVNSETHDISMIPDNFFINDSTVTLKQPGGIIIQEFVLHLATRGVNIIQASEESEVNNPTLKKRILLLGSHFPEERNKCRCCSQYFENQKRLNIHKKTHIYGNDDSIIRSRQVKCPNCGKTFTTRTQMMEHLKTHPPYICEVCGKNFTDNRRLICHQQIHSETKNFVCEFCGNSYKTEANMRVHLRSHENKKFMCEKCGKIFNSIVYFTKHMKHVHLHKSRIACSQCDRTFFSKTTLNLHHRVIHLGLKPYQCMACLRTFGRKDYLKKHYCIENIGQTRRKFRRFTNSKIHDKSQLPCRICGKYYNGLWNLKMHLETHIKIKRLPCKLCPLTFQNVSSLYKHKKQHATYKLRCHVCWKRMDSEEELENHLLHHNNPRHCCDKCGERFHRKYLLNNHVHTKHSTPEDVEKAKNEVYKNLSDILAF